jgi:hypothetical protein
MCLLSGIGNADALRSLNIPVVVGLPGVGQNTGFPPKVQESQCCPLLS